MTHIEISEQVLERLREVAEQQNLAVEEIAETILNEWAQAYIEPEADPLLMIAEAADKLGLRSEEGNIASRSREILNTDYPDDLMRRINEQSDADQ